MRSTQKQYIHYIPEGEGRSHTQLRRWWAVVVVEMNGAGAVMGRGLGSPLTHLQPLAAVRFEVDPGQVTYHSHSGRNIMELLWPELSPRLQQRRQSPNTLSQNGATTARAGLLELALELATDNAFNLFSIPRLYVVTPPVAPLPCCCPFNG
jgi:hypothetical protein